MNGKYLWDDKYHRVPCGQREVSVTKHLAAIRHFSEKKITHVYIFSSTFTRTIYVRIYTYAMIVRRYEILSYENVKHNHMQPFLLTRTCCRQ